ALVCVNDRCSNASMGINSCNHQHLRTMTLKYCLQIRSKKSAISFLHYYLIAGTLVEFWQQLATIRASNGHMQVALPHVQKGIVKIWRKFLPHPENRLTVISKLIRE